MRGGKFQQKVVEDGSTRNAESLFETRSIADIVAIEARTRKEVEEKKEELRQLVGASYRHLIESADSILDMRRSCEAVVRNVAAMESDFALLHKTISTTATTTPAADAKRKRKEALYALGSRVKYLVDTPEKIWGCLDERMFLEAAQRFMRAWEVHQLLSPSPADGVAAGGGGWQAQQQQQGLMASFPLLRHQWPLVETFRTQIVERSRECLHDASRIPAAGVGEYAAALAAVAVMEELSSHDLLALFLDARRACLRSQLASASSALGAGGSFADALASLLSQLVAMIQLTLCQTGQLFLEVSSAERAVLLGVLLQGAPQAQLFGGIPHPDRELALWHQHRDALEARLPSLSSKEVAEACQNWLKACAADIAAESRNLLSRVTQIRHLAQAEAATRAAIANKDIFSASLDWLTSAFGSPPDSPWRALCELLLKEPKDLWSELFEAAFALRAREIIDGALLASRLGDLQKQQQQAEEETEQAEKKETGDGRGAGENSSAENSSESAAATAVGERAGNGSGGADERSRSNGPDSANAAGRLAAQVAVEQALLIGRLAAAVAQRGVGGGSGRRGGRRVTDLAAVTARSAEFARLHEIQRELRRLSILAHSHWVTHSTQLLASAFRRNLMRDPALTTVTPLKGWEETVVQQEGEEGEAKVEMRMTLPASPSPYVASLLFATSADVHRVGCHSLDRLVLRLFAWELSEQVLDAYESVASAKRASEKGVLQLLFDARLLYLPFLWQNQQRFYLRSAVLFGHLAQLNRLYTDAAPRHPYATDANTLDTAPTVPRFTFLPISSPLLANDGLAPGGKPRRPSTFGDVSLSVSGSSSSSGAPVSRVPSGAGGGAVAAAGSGGGFGGVGSGAWGEDGALGGAFSFADSTGLSATPIFKSLMGQVKLGSILGDGSQVTRNISNLQEMFNQPSQAAGLFSSLTSAAAGSSSRLQELF
ncbi:unnamed protein product [Closterium sp. Yama58-4]|nr:unnamed protein product [Closterium sp. Yama58-4]